MFASELPVNDGRLRSEVPAGGDAVCCRAHSPRIPSGKHVLLQYHIINIIHYNNY